MKNKLFITKIVIFLLLGIISVSLVLADESRMYVNPDGSPLKLSFGERIDYNKYNIIQKWLDDSTLMVQTNGITEIDHFDPNLDSTIINEKDFFVDTDQNYGYNWKV